MGEPEIPASEDAGDSNRRLYFRLLKKPSDFKDARTEWQEERLRREPCQLHENNLASPGAESAGASYPRAMPWVPVSIVWVP